MISIHTFELMTALSKDELYLLWEYWDATGEKRKYINHTYSAYGVNIEVERGKKKGFIYLRMRINPNRSINSGDYLNLYEHNEENHKKVWDTIEWIWSEAGAGIPYERLYLSRVDFTIDIKMKSEEMVREYVRLLGKSILIPNRKMVSTSNMRHWKKDIGADEELGIYWKKYEMTGNEDIQIYSKLFQLQNEGIMDHESIDQLGYHVLRLEMQIKRKKLKQILDRIMPGEEIPSNQFKMLLDCEHDLIMERLMDFYKPGRYVRKKEIIKTVNADNSIRMKSKNQIIDLIESSNRSITLGRCLEIDYAKNYEKKRQKSLKFLSDKGYSPVCIGGGFKETDSLPDIFELIAE